jgi:O-antigen/teichoic acid export membrane protein
MKPMLPPPEEEMDQMAASTSQPGPGLLRDAFVIRGRRILGVVTSFLIGQGAAQGLAVLAGLFLVRHLSIQAYAQLGLALGFQTMFSTLMDLGFAGTIIPLVGPHKDDRALVGRYVRSAKRLRDLSFWVLAPIAIVASLAIMHRQHWPFPLQAALLISTLVALYFGGKASYFSAALVLHGKLRTFYVLQVIAGLIRLGSYVLLALAGGLNAWIAAAIGALVIVFTAQSYARQAKPLMDWPAHEDPATDKKIVNFVLPAAPAIIFTAFQAQLTLFLISIFGGQAAYIAQVAALGRIGQLFTVLTTFNLMVIEPFIARRTHHRLLPTFLALTGLACCVLAPVVYAAFAWPQVFLMLIGPKYGDLRDLLGWVILAATVNYVAGLIWMMNRARQWVFWSGSLLEIGLLIGAQIAFVLLVGVRNTRDAVFLTLAASVCVLIAHVYVSILGFWRSHREHRLDPAPSPAVT